MLKTKRTEAEIMRDLLDVFCGLSPENLTCDGEASNAHVVATSKKLFKRLAELETELGRKVDESEVYRYDMKHR
jgi:hypothetical protein